MEGLPILEMFVPDGCPAVYGDIHPEIRIIHCQRIPDNLGVSQQPGGKMYRARMDKVLRHLPTEVDSWRLSSDLVRAIMSCAQAEGQFAAGEEVVCD